MSTINFTLGNKAQNDQSSGLQIGADLGGVDTDVALTDPTFNNLEASVLASGYTADTLFAEDIGGAFAMDSVTVDSDGTLTGVKFADSSGGALDGDDSGLTTLDGDRILLYADATDPDTIVYGVVEGTNTLAFAIEMVVDTTDPSSYTIDFNVISYIPINHGDTADHDESVDLGNNLHIVATDVSGLFDFSVLDATKFLYGVVGGTDGGFLVIGKDPAIKADGTPVNGGGAGDEINTSKGGGEVTIGVNNQHFTADADTSTVEQGAYFTYTTGLTAGTYNDADDITPTGLVGVNEARLQVSQTQAQSTTPPGMRITTLDYTLDAGQAFVGDLNDADHGTAVALTGLRIYDSTPGGTPLVDIDLSTWSVGDSTTIGQYTIILQDTNVVDIIGLDQKDWVEWDTSGLHNRVLVEALSGKWDIGGFEIDLPSSDSTAVGQQIVFDDDGPTAAIVQGDMVLHDETVGVDAGSDDQGGALPAAFGGLGGTLIGWAESDNAVVSDTGTAFGTDGDGGTVYSIDVSSAGVDSGLDTVDGADILLTKEGDLVVGRVSGTNELAFAISIDGTSGVLSVAQYLAIKHPDDSDPDDVVAIADAAVIATATVTDGDGDTDEATLEIGDAVKFRDDGPTAAIVQGDMVLHDETVGVDAGSDDQGGALPAAFGGLGGTLIGWAESDSAVVSDTGTAFGTDGDGGTVYSIGVSADDVDSGLDTVDGFNILLNKEGDLVIGRVDAIGDNDVDDTDAIAFAISIDSLTGVLSVAQYLAIDHGPGGDPDNVVAIADAAVIATATVTDGDGDTDEATLEIGDAVKFRDDGPTAAIVQGDMVLHDETVGVDAGSDDQGGALPAAFGGLGGTLIGWAESDNAVVSDTGTAFGTDGDGGTMYSIDVSSAGVDSGLDTVDGADILLTKEGDLVVGRVSGTNELAFAISIDGTSGVLSVAQYLAIKHPDDSDPDDVVAIADAAVIATATVTDGDGDTSEATLEIGDAVKFRDDGPSVDIEIKDGAMLVLDETVGDGDDPGTGNPLAMASIGAADYLMTNDAAAGTDGEKSDVWEFVDPSGALSDLVDTETGNSVYLFLEAGKIVGREGMDAVDAAGGEIVLEFSIDAGDGTVTVTQTRAVMHDDPDDPDESSSPETLGDPGLVVVKRTLTDNDDDSASDMVDLTAIFKFEDDGPDFDITLKSDAVLPLDETDPDGDEQGGFIAQHTITANNLFEITNEDFGSDGMGATPVNYAFKDFPAANTDSGLIDSQTGLAVIYNLVGGVIIGTAGIGGPEVIRYEIDATSGDVTAKQSRAITHTDTNSDDETQVHPGSFKIVIERTIFDGDGDHVTKELDVTIIVEIDDDGPSIGDGAGNLTDLQVDFETGSTDSTPLNEDGGSDTTKSIRITSYSDGLVVNGVALTALLSDDEQTVWYFEESGANAGYQAGEDTLYYTYEIKDVEPDGDLDAVFTVHDVPPPSQPDFSLNDLPAGQNGFGILASRSAPGEPLDPDGPSLVILGREADYDLDGTFTNSSDTINTSKGGGPTTIGNSNQMIDPPSNNDSNGEGVFFAYVDDPNDDFVSGIAGGLTQNEADDFDNILYSGGMVEVTGAFFSVVQVQGNPKTATAQITAFDLADNNLQGTDLVDELVKQGDPGTRDLTPVLINEVTITDVNGVVQHTATLAGGDTAFVDFISQADADALPGDDITNEDVGTVIVSGIAAGDTISFKTAAVHDVALIDGLAGKFDIGDYGIDLFNPTPDQLLDFTVEITDMDNDTETASHSVGIDGTGIYDDGIIVV